ncbi:MAG TPA: VIT and VWA domain-containing protein [Tepidisphaeraceae bacterium]|nr:VIT and VWA domain-containing protein [Tepidisphaeraceae bacterium]
MPQTLEPAVGGPQLVTANPSDRIALRGVRLNCRVAGISATATVEQTFVNLEAKAIEAVYTFPLPDGAAVCGFEVVFFDKVFTGALEEADKAVERYDDAIAEGHGAYLVEQHRPDVFSVRVGNLKPRQAVTLRLTYVMDLEVVDRSIRLAFPTTIAPRYVTDSGTDPVDAMIDGEALNPPHVLSVPYGLTAEIQVDLGRMLRGVTSPTHSVVVKHEDMKHEEGASRHAVLVTLAGGVAEMNRDLVLNLELAKEREPFALAATNAQGETFVALSFLPEFEEADLETTPSAEAVFVLDCSGSMQGESIRQASAALECCLRAMSAGDAFNVCRFGSNFEMLSPEPLVYSQATLGRALAFVNQGADLGGTELLAPLEAIFATRPAGKSAARNVVLLTDGQVSNEPAVIALARRKRSRNRIFTFGIGSACSQFLVSGLARVTGGAAEFIAPGERIEDKVLRTFGRLASPPVTDVEIDWGNADADVAPRELPPVFDGDGLRAFARLAGRVPETVTLKCVTPAGPREWSVRVGVARDGQDVLPRFWARAAIRAIEDEHAQAAHSSAVVSGSDAAKRMIALSLKYGVQCAKTSFVAVEHRSLEERNEGRPELRRVPIALAEGWGGVVAETAMGGSMMACAAPAACAPMAMPSPAQPAGRPLTKGFVKKMRKMIGLEARMADKGGAKAAPAGPGRAADSAAAVPPPPPREEYSRRSALPADAGHFVMACEIADDSGSGDPLVDILSVQQADGSFAGVFDETLRATGVDSSRVFEVVTEVVGRANLPKAAPSEAILTLTVLAVLRIALADRLATWKRAAKKGAAFVAKVAGVEAKRVEAWLAEVERVVRGG